VPDQEDTESRVTRSEEPAREESRERIAELDLALAQSRRRVEQLESALEQSRERIRQLQAALEEEQRPKRVPWWLGGARQ
jgi:hypothetical protein